MPDQTEATSQVLLCSNSLLKFAYGLSDFAV